MKDETLGEIAEGLERSRFFGTLEIKFEAGRVVLLRKTETIKLAPKSNHNYRDNRGNHEQKDTE